MAERSSALDSSSGVVRMWVRIPAWPVEVLVYLSKTLNRNCFVLRMGRKAVCPVCLCNARKRTQDTNREREGACPGVSGFAHKHPAAWICAHYKSSVFLLLLYFTIYCHYTLRTNFIVYRRFTIVIRNGINPTKSELARK